MIFIKKSIQVKSLLLLAIIFAGLFFSTCTSNNQAANTPQQSIKETKKMEVEIWSDVVCPFCYIGKRKFENALSKFEHKDNIKVIWKSYQLNPDQKTDASKNSIQALAANRNISIAESAEMHGYVVDMAKAVGLNYNMDKTISANSLKAHRFIHYAKSKNKQDEAEEKLFQAYFMDGVNIDDDASLIAIGKSIGLDEPEVSKVLASTDFESDVKHDIYEAQQVGVRGVPYFVFDQKTAVSGAQESDTFLNALKQSYSKWKEVNP